MPNFPVPGVKWIAEMCGWELKAFLIKKQRRLSWVKGCWRRPANNPPVPDFLEVWKALVRECKGRGYVLKLVYDERIDIYIQDSFKIFTASDYPSIRDAACAALGYVAGWQAEPSRDEFLAYMEKVAAEYEAQPEEKKNMLGLYKKGFPEEGEKA